MSVVDKEASKQYQLKANDLFRAEKYNDAIELYTEAIRLNPDEPQLFGNRSMAYLRTEMYGLALEDASRSISLDEAYIKGYYRRAAANMAMGKFKLALADYEAVVKVRPSDPDVKAKLDECRRTVRMLAFVRAIAVDAKDSSPFDSVDPTAIAVEADYQGPVLESDGQPTVEFVERLVETFKQEKKLHKKYAYQILFAIRELMRNQPTLVNITVPPGCKFTICGDIHGQFYDLLNIFHLNDVPSEENPFLFNGDFVDRGSFCVETVFTLFTYKLLYPNHVFLSRGNHESELMNKMYGFDGEVRSKYSGQMAEMFTEVFNLLPLVHLINERILVMHGGLPTADNVRLADLVAIDRFRQPPDEGLMCDLLWSDPQLLPGRSASKRGVGSQFGPDVTKRFCELNNLSYVVRSHEVKPNGYEVMHDGQCITVFSAPNYCDTMGNKGAFIKIKGDDLTPVFVTYDAVDHPKVTPMAYANNFFSALQI